MVRSRCKMIDEYEHPTKFCLNLEKSNNKVRHIHSLFINGEKIEDNDRILEAQKDYYSKHYNPGDKSIQKCNFSNFLQGKIFPQILHDTSVLCETVITIEEVKKQL